MKKSINNIILTIGFIIYIVGVMLCSTSENNEMLPIALATYSLYAILIMAFSFAKSKALNICAYSISAIAGVEALSLITSVSKIENFDAMLIIFTFGIIVMMIPAVIILINSILNLFGFTKVGRQTTSDSKIDLLRLYAEINKDGIISDDEFIAKKAIVIKGNLKENKEEFEQLKQLKRLYDEQVITKEEFITFNVK